jgi:HAD superfamily phosphoserine phosphatase-like hydrolase
MTDSSIQSAPTAAAASLRVAFLDLDHTLLAADSNQLWLDYLLQRGQVQPEQIEAHDRFVDDYGRGRLDFVALQRFRHAIDAALPAAQLAGLRAGFEAEALLPAIAREAAALVDRLHADGLLTLVVSATRQSLVQPVADQLGIAHVIGADSQPELEAHCFGAGKIAHVEYWLSQRGSSIAALAESRFYSDSHNDLPLLEAVQQLVAVDPDPQLLRSALERGWPVMSLRG